MAPSPIHARLADASPSSSQIPRTPNPFFYPGQLTPYECFKLCLGVIIVPLRVFLALVILVLAWCFARLSIVNIDPASSGPLSPWRLAVQKPIAYLCRSLLFVWGFYWVETTGTPAPSSQAKMIACAPHSTFFDSLYIFYAYNLPSGIGKQEALNSAIMGVFSRAMQMVAVDRNTPEGKKLALEQLAARASQPHARQFMAFCEGTCHNRRQLIELKKGIFTPGLAVQPVVLEFPHRFFDLTWSSAGPNRGFMIYWALSQFSNRMRVNFLPPHAPTDAEKQDAVLFANNVRTEMATFLGGIPTTSHSYGDMFLAKSAKKHGLLPAAINFELRALQARFPGLDEAH